jgi:hypothetical protein
MAGTSILPRIQAPELSIPASIRDNIIARWSCSGMNQRGSRTDVAVDIGGNQLILSGTALTLDDRDQAAALAAVDALGMLIDNMIRLPAVGVADHVH